MKQFIPFFSLAILVAACNSKPAETETKTIQSTQTAALPVDTAGLSQFQQWKAQNELAVAQETQQAEQPVAEAAPVKTVTIIREVRVPQQAPARRTVRQSPQPAPKEPAVTENKSDNTTSGSNSDVASNSGSSTSTGEAPATKPEETAKDKGWSNSTKGAVIGSAGGAVIGAVINKRNRTAGAVIGGVLGGAVGYGIGKKKDNKEVQQ
jgi:hypothetical protein